MADAFNQMMETTMPRLQRAMAFFPQVTVGTVAVQVVTTPLKQRRRLVVQNTGATEVRLGGMDVTATTGMKLPAGEHLQFDFGSLQNGLYAISAGTSTLDGYESC